MLRRVGWAIVFMALMGLFVGGCGWKKKAVIAACQCMVDCASEISVDTPEEMMECKRECKGANYEGWDQGSQLAMQVLDGVREDCSY
jgi:hypothetical protein